MIYWLGYYFMRLMRFLFFPCRIIGKENIPSTGAFIFSSNHSSNLDPFILGIIPSREIYFFAKKELFKNPLLGWLLRQWHAFPVDRHRADIGALKKSIRYLRNGCPLVFFPQGTRNRPGKKARTFSGIGFLVSKTGAPVVPVYIKDSDKSLPPGAKFPKRHPVTVVIGKPVIFPQSASHENIAQGVMERIHALPLSD